MPNSNVTVKLPKAAAQSVPWPSYDATYTRNVTIDCSDWVAFVFAGSITTVTLTSATGVTVGSLAASGRNITFTQSGGSNGTNNAVVMNATTDTGRVETITLEIPIGSDTKGSTVYARLAHDLYVPPQTGVSYAAASDLTTEISARTTAIQNETTARIADVDQETSDRAAAVSTETTARIADVDLETSDRVAAITGEVTSRNNAISAAVTPIAARFGFFSITDYGTLHADGTTDDLPSFAGAISAAKTFASLTGGLAEVSVPQGKYAVNGAIQLTDTTGNGVNVRLVGRGKPTIKSIGATGGVINVFGKNVQIENLTLDGNYSTHTSDFTSALTFNGTTYATSRARVRNVDIINPNGGFSLNTVSQIEIEECSIVNSKLHSVYMVASFDCRIAANRIDNGGGFGVILTSACYRNLIVGNTTLSNAIELVGITQDSYENKVLYNHAEGTGDNGISVTGYKNTIMGNVCKGCQGNGIELYGERNTCVGNICLNNAKGNAGNAGWRAGIAIAGAFGGLAQQNTVTGNICDDDQAVPTQIYGIWISGQTGYTAWASGQTITGTAGSPVYRYNGANLYRSLTAGTTGSTAPTHTSGSVNDGGVDWIFVRTALAGAIGAFGNEVSSNNISRAVTAKILDASGGTGSTANEILGFQPLVLPSTLTVSSLNNTGGVGSISVSGSYTVRNGSTLALTIGAPNISGGQQAAANVTSLNLFGFGTIAGGGSGGSGYSVNDIVTVSGGTPTGVAGKLKVVTVDGSGAVLTFTGTGAGGGFTYSALPPSGNLLFTGGTGTGFQLAASVWTILAITVTSAGSGYTAAPTVSLAGMTGSPVWAVTTTASMSLSAGAGALLLDGTGTKVGSTGSPVIFLGPTVDNTLVGTALTGSAYTVPAGVSDVHFTQTSSVATQTVTLPTGLIVGQKLSLSNYGSEVTSLSFSPAVSGWAAGTALPPYQTIELEYNGSNWISLKNFKPGFNFLHNGDFYFNQRLTIQGNATVSGAYAVDRWIHFDDGTAGNRTLSQYALTDTDRAQIGKDDLIYGVRIQTTAGNATSSYELLCQRMENVRRLAGKTVSLTFWARAAATASLAVEFAQSFGTGGSPSADVLGIGSNKITIGTTLKKYTMMVAIPTIVGKTVGSSGNDFTALYLFTSAGSNFNARSASLGVQTSDITLVGMKIEEGMPSAFEVPDRQENLLNCQRFFQVVVCSNRGTASAPANFGTNVSWTPMRAVPSVTQIGTAGLTGNVNVNTLSAYSNQNGAFVITSLGAGDAYTYALAYALGADL